MPIPNELQDEFAQAGFGSQQLPPSPRNEIPFLEDDYNFKKAIITPKEPVEYLKGLNGETFEVPIYTSTMALGNLSTNEVGAERDDWRIARICKRYGYNNIVVQQYYAITDRVIATQSHQATMLAAVTVQQYGMRRVESVNRDGQAIEDDSNPLAKLISSIKGAPGKSDEMAAKRESTTARYRA